MKKSIGKKILFFVLLLGVVLVGIVLSNVSALNRIGRQNSEIEENVREYFSAAKSSDNAKMKEIESLMDEEFHAIEVRIDGTVIFDVILVAVFAAVFILIVFIVVRTIALPAKKASRQLNNIVEKIEKNEGDLTERIEIKSKDEVGQLARGINAFLEQLQDIMRKLQNESGRMMESVDKVTSHVNESNESAGTVSAAMEELSASMEEVSATIEQIAAGSDGIFKEVQVMTNRADEGANLVDEIKVRANDMYRSTVDSKEAAGTMISEMRDMLESAVQESRSVEKINELTGDILDITSQTNLLALNASIEAARAGEAGKGFAVVADEIRVLADSSRDTANNIQVISNLVTGAVEKLAKNAEDMLKFIDEKVIKDYDGFVGIVNQYQDDADSINEIIVEFARNTADVADTMERINSGINDISITVDESAKGIANVAENAVSLVDAIAIINDETESNQKISRGLESEVNRFKNV